VAKNEDANIKRKQAREAHKEGMSASEAGVSTGASKQIKHLKSSEREPKGDRKS
jgi:hypothetical protein